MRQVGDRLPLVETHRWVDAQPTHRAHSKIKGRGIPPSSIVDDKRDSFARKTLRHPALGPVAGEVLRALQDGQEIGAGEVIQGQEVASHRSCHVHSPPETLKRSGYTIR